MADNKDKRDPRGWIFVTQEREPPGSLRVGFSATDPEGTLDDAQALHYDVLVRKAEPIAEAVQRSLAVHRLPGGGLGCSPAQAMQAIRDCIAAEGEELLAESCPRAIPPPGPHAAGVLNGAACPYCAKPLTYADDPRCERCFGLV